MTVKRYKQTGVGSALELGKNGVKISSVNDDLEVRDAAGDLGNIDIADGVDPTHAVTKAQLDATISSANPSDVLVISFSDTAAPVESDPVITTSSRVVKVVVNVTVPFDGTDTNMTIGTSATSPDNIDNGESVNLGVIGIYLVDCAVAGEDAPLRVTLTGTDVTAGAAEVSLFWITNN